MGAEYDSVLVRGGERTIQEIWDAIHGQALWENGHGGYTGSLAEKGNIEVIPGEWDADAAEDHCDEHNGKWDPAYAYRLKNGNWYIGGWCSD